MRYIQHFVQQAPIRLLITNALTSKIAIYSFLTILSTPIYGTYINPLLQTQLKKAPFMPEKNKRRAFCLNSILPIRRNQPQSFISVIINVLNRKKTANSAPQARTQQRNIIKKAAFTANQATSKVISPHKPGQDTPPSPARKMDTNHSNLKSRGLTLSENNHSVPIGETSATKFSFSAIMTPFVTQKRGIFAAIYAKTALASYLL